jgi:dihydrodipicolinate reductase
MTDAVPAVVSIAVPVDVAEVTASVVALAIASDVLMLIIGVGINVPTDDVGLLAPPTEITRYVADVSVEFTKPNEIVLLFLVIIAPPCATVVATTGVIVTAAALARLLIRY